jgi:Spy/CpxP family protein refolding chaperone
LKRNGLLYLVIFSLALNLGTIGTLVYLRYQDQRQAAAREALPPLPLRELWTSLHLDAEQRQALRGLFPEHRRRVQELRGALAQKRLELFELLKGEAPKWSTIQNKVQEISTLQGSLEEEMARFLLEFKKHLKPGQDAAFLNLVQTRLGRACGPMGPRHGPPHRGRGPGMGPRGPAGPEGPPD